MKTLTKEEMIRALAKICVQKKVFDYIKQDTEEDIIKYLSLSDDIDTDIEYATGETDNYIVECVSTRGSEGDGADMFCTFKIIDKEYENTGYLEFTGRYSSWDSSYYDEHYIVLPEEVTVIQYKRI